MKCQCSKDYIVILCLVKYFIQFLALVVHAGGKMSQCRYTFQENFYIITMLLLQPTFKKKLFVLLSLMFSIIYHN